MIGPGAVVADAAPELREHKQDHVVGVIVLAKVLHEGVDPLGHRFPQNGVAPGAPSCVLAGMSVESAVIAIEDAGAQIGKMHLGDTLELTGDRRVGILHRRRIPLRRYLQDVFALQRINTGVSHVVHDGAGADRRFVHRREPLEDLLALVALNGRQESVVLQRPADARHRHARHSRSPRQARSKTNRGDDVFLFGVELASHAPEPAFCSDFDRLASVPDVHGPEMRPRRLLPADAVQDGELVVIPELLDRRHVVRDAVILVEMHDLVVGDPDRLPVIPVQRIVVGDRRVHIVISARQLQDNNNGILLCFLCCWHCAFLLV